MDIKTKYRIFVFGILLYCLDSSLAQIQGSSDGCSKFYRQSRRAGLTSYGRFDIPVDSEFPKFKLQVKFSRAIHSMSFRQAKARDLGAHREFSIDMLEPKNGILSFNSITRLRGLFGHTPRVTKIIHNGKTLCGGEFSTSDSTDSIVVDSPTFKKGLSLKNRS